MWYCFHLVSWLRLLKGRASNYSRCYNEVHGTLGDVAYWEMMVHERSVNDPTLIADGVSGV